MKDAKGLRQLARIGTISLFGLVLTGCATLGLQYQMEPVDVSTLDPDYPSLMVAEKVSTPLRIVLEPDRVPDEQTVQAPRMKPIEVTNIRSFVRDHLKGAMENYFETVRVAGPDEEPEFDRYVEGRVAVQDLGATMDSAVGNSGRATRVFGTVNWSFALGPSSGDEFLFSYAGSTRGNFSLTHVSQTGEMYEATFERALSKMLKKYVEGDGHEEVANWANQSPTPEQSTPTARGGGPAERSTRRR